VSGLAIRVVGAFFALRLLLRSIRQSLSAFASIGFGYDFTWWGSILGSVHFNQVFGDQEVPLPTGGTTRMLSTKQTSVGTGLGSVGLVIGAMVSSDSPRIDKTDPDSEELLRSLRMSTRRSVVSVQFLAW
jgi:hypothetical protein